MDESDIRPLTEKELNVFQALLNLNTPKPIDNPVTTTGLKFYEAELVQYDTLNRLIAMARGYLNLRNDVEEWQSVAKAEHDLNEKLREVIQKKDEENSNGNA